MASEIFAKIAALFETNPEAYPALISIVLGGLFQFLRFIISPKEVLTRINRHSESLHERVAETLRVAIEHGTHTLLGDPQTATNPYFKHIQEFTRVLTVKEDLWRIHARTKWAYRFLFFSVLVGVVLSVTNAVWPAARPTIAMAGSSVLIVQLWTFWTLYRLSEDLERIEKQT